jgi:hypothetical protein
MRLRRRLQGLSISYDHLGGGKGDLFIMRRVVLALFTLFALTFGMTTSVGASGHNCADYVSQAAAQSVYDADPSDPNGLDGNDNDGRACETYNYASNPGLLGGNTGTTGGTGSTGGGTSTLPTVGSGAALSIADNSMMLVTGFGSIAAVLGLAALRLRQQS